MAKRIATEKDEAYIIRRRAEGATYRMIAKKMKADPELTSLSRTTVHKYVVPEARKQDYATKKKYLSTEQGALENIWGKMQYSGHKVEMTFEQFVNAWEEQKKKRGYACPLGGGTIDFKVTTHKEKHRSNRISPDRIDNTKEYTLPNLWFVTTKKNRDKGSCTLDIMELTLEEKKKREAKLN
jgi:hypothetical protein